MARSPDTNGSRASPVRAHSVQNRLPVDPLLLLSLPRYAPRQPVWVQVHGSEVKDRRQLNVAREAALYRRIASMVGQPVGGLLTRGWTAFLWLLLVGAWPVRPPGYLRTGLFGALAR